jgi:hypothetical protein
MKKNSKIRIISLCVFFLFLFAILTHNLTNDLLIPKSLSDPEIGAAYLSSLFIENISDNTDPNPSVAQFWRKIILNGSGKSSMKK